MKRLKSQKEKDMLRKLAITFNFILNKHFSEPNTVLVRFFNSIQDIKSERKKNG